MNEYDVIAESRSIDFGATGVKEILQNVWMIISTVVFSCPLDRGFAWEPVLDTPSQFAQAKLTARLTTAIHQYEPRAQVVRITYRGDPLKGQLIPVVKVRIADDAI